VGIEVRPCGIVRVNKRAYEPFLKMGGVGDPPAPVGDPPTGTASSKVAKRRAPWFRLSLSFRPARRRTAQAGRLCYQQTISDQHCLGRRLGRSVTVAARRCFTRRHERYCQRENKGSFHGSTKAWGPNPAFH